MHFNWVKQATSTTGTGTITLGAAETGFITMASAGVEDGEQVEYFIVDGNNRERGIGTYTASGTTLARTTVLETLVSGTYDNTSPTAISLSGNAVVFMSAAAQRIMQGPIILGGSVGEASSWDLPDNITQFSNSGFAISVANRMSVVMGSLLFPRIITTLRYRVTTADAGCTHFRLGIYKADHEGEPGRVIYDSGDLSSSAASTGNKSHTVSGGPIYLPAGLYGFAIVSDSTTLGHRACSYADQTGPTFGVNSVNNFRRYCHSVTSVTGALPNNPSTGFFNATSPIFGWR